MRHGFRWVAATLVLALMLPAAAGALPTVGFSSRGGGWNPWTRIVAFVAGLLSAKQKPGFETGCGIDGSGLPKCNS